MGRISYFIFNSRELFSPSPFEMSKSFASVLSPHPPTPSFHKKHRARKRKDKQHHIHKLKNFSRRRRIFANIISEWRASDRTLAGQLSLPCRLRPTRTLPSFSMTARADAVNSTTGCLPPSEWSTGTMAEARSSSSSPEPWTLSYSLRKQQQKQVLKDFL